LQRVARFRVLSHGREQTVRRAASGAASAGGRRRS
jgi:hypothetical protein